MHYVQPESLEQAAALLANKTGVSRILAGGTDVLVQLKSETVEPDLLVDLKHLAGMKDIIAENGGYRVGAAVSGAELGEHAGMCAMWPGVVEGMELIGSTQVQGRATLAGNLCNGSPAADSVPAMVTAGAVARVFGPNGQRDIQVIDIPTGPGQNSLTKGEFITSIYFPARGPNASDAYLRFIPRTEMDIAVSSAAVSLELDAQGACTNVQIAVGAVAPTVRLVSDAGAALNGSTLDDAAMATMMSAVQAACSPIDDKRGTIEFRTQTAAVLAKRAAHIAFARAGGQS